MREVAEESGVEVGDVVVVGSQPWPVGAFGCGPVTCVSRVRQAGGVRVS